VASRKRIDAYRVRRPHTALSDDMIAWELDHAPDCAAVLPPDFKQELERLAWEDEDRPPASLAASTRAPLSLYDFKSSPHGGHWKPIPDHGGEPTLSPTTHIHHSIVGSAAGAWGYFANSTSIESTNIVLKSGYLWQIMSRREQADANYKANAFAISTETEDNGNPNTDPWTGAQIDTLVWVTLQDIRDFAIPRRVAPGWDKGGIGYHSMFGAPSQWTPAAGKTCPGTIRKRQWNTIVVPRILGQIQEEDLSMADAQAILDELKRMRQDLTVFGTTGLEPTVEDFATRQRDTLAALKRLEAKVDAIENQLAGP
jgi:N-acetylmuramoyl-L-alanine amidase